MKIISLPTIPETTTSHQAVGKKKNIIPKGVIPSLAQFSQAVFQPGEIVAEHKHEDMYEVFLVEDGTGVIKINGETYQLEKGVCVVVEPKELHEVTTTGSKALRLKYFGIEEKK